MGRTVTPIGDEIKRLRAEKRWRVEDLAENCGLAKRTIERLESSEPCFYFTISKVADALGVDATIISGDGTPNPQRVTVDLELSKPPTREGVLDLAQALTHALVSGGESGDVEITDEAEMVQISLSRNELVALATLLPALMRALNERRPLNVGRLVTNPYFIGCWELGYTESQVDALLSIASLVIPDDHQLPDTCRDRRIAIAV